MWVNFLFLQSAMPSAHLQGVGQVQEAEGKHSKVSSSSKKNKKNKIMHNKDTKDQVNPSKIFLFIKTYWQNFARFHCLTAECTENEKNLVRPKKWIDFCVYLFKENMACHHAISL